MAITAAMVKELREMTGAGMMDCKKALNATEGDMDKAVEFLREKGLAAMAKKANRVAAEGIVAAKVSEDGKTAAIVEVNSETDFVAKNADFQAYVARVVEQVLASNADSMESFMAEPWIDDASVTVEQALSQKIAIIGEKLSIRRFEKVSAADGVVASYIHGGGKIGVLAVLETSASGDAVSECGKNVAMQVAALNPKYVTRDEVPADFVEHEKEILKTAAMNENPNKPENIIDKMIIGRLNKELKEICLVDQAYVKDGDLSVKKYVDSVAKEVGAAITVKSFVRYQTGEGIEKREDDFAAEVAKQAGM
ncbi:MAG TPA: elongation factor Ts [Candidatus Scybalocola faecipullorum]|nr:elongation factor Ts [Candidatus Scybalocola faecipullorum]